MTIPVCKVATSTYLDVYGALSLFLLIEGLFKQLSNRAAEVQYVNITRIIAPHQHGLSVQILE